jgi:hypothetical protein
MFFAGVEFKRWLVGAEGSRGVRNQTQGRSTQPPVHNFVCPPLFGRHQPTPLSNLPCIGPDSPAAKAEAELKAKAAAEGKASS